MTRLFLAWTCATVWALVALLRAIQFDLTLSIVFCAIGVGICALQAATTWGDDA